MYALKSLPKNLFVVKSLLQPLTIKSPFSTQIAQRVRPRHTLETGTFFSQLRNIGIDFFCGVPDSLLKDFYACLSENTHSNQHITTVNEGQAVAVATGYHLATGKTALVYLQNSGLGNTLDPILSSATTGVYNIPMLLLISWRGEPQIPDEPQHLVQGPATPQILSSIGIPFQSLPGTAAEAQQALNTAQEYLRTKGGPYALLLSRDTFVPHSFKKTSDTERATMTREEAVQCIAQALHNDDAVVSSTGMMSRELFEYRSHKAQGHQQDFLNLGNMGHASAIAMGIALQKPNKKIFCLDGDGAALMHMGALATIGSMPLKNFKHIILNNGRHDSTGGQPTVALDGQHFSFQSIAKACGYKETKVVDNLKDLTDYLVYMREMPGPMLLDVRVKSGNRKNLGRPTDTPAETKKKFMSFLLSNE